MTSADSKLNAHSSASGSGSAATDLPSLPNLLSAPTSSSSIASTATAAASAFTFALGGQQVKEQQQQQQQQEKAQVQFDLKEQYPPVPIQIQSQPRDMFTRPKSVADGPSIHRRPANPYHQHLYSSNNNPLGTPMTLLANDLGASLNIRNTPPTMLNHISNSPLVPFGTGPNDTPMDMDDADPLSFVAVSPSGSPDNSMSFPRADEDLLMDDVDCIMNQTMPTPSGGTLHNPMVLATPGPARRTKKRAPTAAASPDAMNDEGMGADDDDENEVASPASTVDPTTPCPRPRPKAAARQAAARANEQQLQQDADPGADSGVILMDEPGLDATLLAQPILPPAPGAASSFAAGSAFGFPGIQSFNQRLFQSSAGAATGLTAKRPGLNRSRSEATLPLAGRKRTSFMAFAASPPHPPASASASGFGSAFGGARSASNFLTGRHSGSSSSFASSSVGSSFTGIAPPSLSDDDSAAMELDQGFYEQADKQGDADAMDVSDTPLGARRPMKRTRFSSPAASPSMAAMARTRGGTVPMRSMSATASTPSRGTQSDGEQHDGQSESESSSDDEEEMAMTPSIRRPTARRAKSVGTFSMSSAAAAGAGNTFTFSLPADNAPSLPQHRDPADAPRAAGEPLLPSKMGKSDSIRRITPETLVDLLAGRFSTVADFRVIDVRFPFEYEGGHIAGAINVNSFEDLDAMFFTGGDHVPRAMHSTAIVFHCEFSSHRAPAMAMHLRAQDRIVNMSRYPAVYYPEIYVLEGGYKRFWSELPSRCMPHGAYIPMDHEEFRDVCKHEVAQRRLSLARSKSSNDAFAPSLNRNKSNGGGVCALPAIPASPCSPCVGAAAAVKGVRKFMLPGLVRSSSALVVPAARLEVPRDEDMHEMESPTVGAAARRRQQAQPQPQSPTVARGTLPWAESPI